MLAKRIIPCLDVKNGYVVKGVRFKAHKQVGDIIQLAQMYQQSGADELVFYDITASCEKATVKNRWISDIAKFLDIPFCVAGGIDSVDKASAILEAGADKISINSPALSNPTLIDDLVNAFGSQCVVIGVDSYESNNQYEVYQYTGSSKTIKSTKKLTLDWLSEVQDRGAGEVVLNCMNQDGVKCGYDLKQLSKARQLLKIPLIASGGAGQASDFLDVFNVSHVDGALAASVFHNSLIKIQPLKQYLNQSNIEVRL